MHRLIAVTRHDHGPTLEEVLRKWWDVPGEPTGKLDYFREVGWVEVEETTVDFLGLMGVSAYVTAAGEWLEKTEFPDPPEGTKALPFQEWLRLDLKLAEERGGCVTHLVSIHN